jgi:thiol:disulfide interchange protein DsbC
MKSRIALLFAVVLPLMACAQDSAPAKPVVKSVPAGDPRIALAATIPGVKPEDLRVTPVSGIYEISNGTDISYITADGGYVFSGDLYKVTSTGDFPNLSEERRRDMRLAMLAKVPESQMLVFGPANATHTLTVFTDVDCTYCRQMHSQIADYNRLGMRLRYLFFPRTGPDSESWEKAETVWCSTDRKAAFTRAKQGKKLDLKACPGSPVAREYELGSEIGLTGTPGIVLESGELIPGYLAPPDMVAHINEAAAKAKAAKSAKPAAAK